MHFRERVVLEDISPRYRKLRRAGLLASRKGPQTHLRTRQALETAQRELEMARHDIPANRRDRRSRVLELRQLLESL